MTQPLNQKEEQHNDKSPKALARQLLGDLLPAQFEEVLGCYEVPDKYISKKEPQATQTNELIKYALQKEGKELTQLLKIIDGVMPQKVLKASKSIKIFSRSIPYLRLLPYLPNREDQILELGEAIKAHHNTQRPLLCLIHGNEDECSDMFLECLEKEYLPTLASQYTQYGIRLSDFDCDFFSNMAELHKKMLASLGLVFCDNRLASRQEVIQRVGCEPGLRILHTNLSSNHWQRGGGINIIHDFIHFWDDWTNLPSQNFLLLVCLSFKYRKTETPSLLRRLFRQSSMNDKISRALEKLELKNGVVRLPKLDKIEIDQVESWVKMYLRDYSAILLPKIRKIFQGPQKKMAMEQIALHLQELIKECYPEGG